VFATPRPHGPGIEDIALARLGLQRRVAVRCQHAITAWQIVAKTDMLCTLPRSHVRMLQHIWPMQLFDLPIAVAQSSSYLYWHRAVQADVGLAWLRAIILEVMREE
jgi:DNA-binding transcriptional LysR family regulator